MPPSEQQIIININMLRNNINWVILAGGKASRMGGGDKGLIKLNGTPLVEIVYNALLPQVSQLYINANRNIEQYQSYALVIKDNMQDFQGPLAGVHSCLTEIDQEWIGFTPCDSPNIPSDLVERLAAAIDNEVEIIVAHDGQYPQPVFSLWNKRALPALSAFLENGDRKIKLLLNQCKTTFVDFSDIPDTFINLNTPDELKKFGETHE